MKYLPIFFIVLILSLSSCATTSKTVSPVNIDEKTSYHYDNSVLTGKWELISFEKDGLDISIVPDTAPDVIGINFGIPSDDIYPASGFLGVNRFFESSVTIKDNKKNRDDNKNFIGKGFSIGQASTTLRTGPDGHLAFEAVFKECLFTADKLSLKDENTMIIYNTEKNSEMVFSRVNN